MPLSTATITFDISDQLGVDYDRRRDIRAWVDTNIPNDTVVDTDGNKVRVGTGKVTIDANGTGSFTVWTPGAGSNPATWQTSLHVEYIPSGNAKEGRKTRTFGPFTITGNADLADLIEEQEVPPEYAGQIVAEMEALRDETEDARDDTATSVGVVAAHRAAVEAVVINDLGITDGQAKTLAETNGTLFRTALLKGFVRKAPPPTGVKATDEANVQPLVDAAQAAGGQVILQEGTYVMDIVTTRLDKQPKITGQGERLTQWNGTLKMNGVPAAFSGGYLSDFSFIGTRSAGVAMLHLRGACDVRWDRVGFFGTADIGILFENDAAHTFTEMSAGQAHFGLTIKKALEFRVSSGGNPSFHACGLTTGSTINQSKDDAGPKILIGTGAEPYNSPLSVTLWARTAVPLIRHDGLGTVTFYGDIKVELLPRNPGDTYADSKAIVVDPAGKVVPLTGSLSKRGKYVDSSALLVGEEAITETGTSVLKTGGARRSTRPGDILRIGPNGQPEWVGTVRINRAVNPQSGNNTVNFAPYFSVGIAQVSGTALGAATALGVTFNNPANTQGFIHLQPATDLAAGQKKTVAFDILSPVDLTAYAGGWFGLSGSPGSKEVGENGITTGDIEYIPANVVRRVRRVVTVPAPNSGGTITHEGLYLRVNTTADAPPNGTVVLVGNITIEDGETSGSKFYGGDLMGSVWQGVAHQSRSVQYPSSPPVAVEQAYTPTLTGITLGAGQVWAYYSRDGKRVTGSIRIKWAADTVVTGAIGFSLPTDAPLVSGDPRGYSGSGWCNDFSISQRFIASVLPFGTTRLDIRCHGGGTGGFHIQLAANATQPMAWAVNDELFMRFEYEAA